MREAILKAAAVEFEGTPTRVFRAEYLCAIALQTGRVKDYLRVRMFLEQGAVERKTLFELLERFSLLEQAERSGVSRV